MRDLIREFAPIFYPSSIAVIGANSKENKYGGHFVRLLQESGFKGKIYPISLNESEIFGLKAYRSVLDIPEPADLASISIPAKLVPPAVKECLQKGIKAVEIFSAGFSEAGAEGIQLEQQLTELSRQGIRIIGPNCFGIYCPSSGLTMLPCQDLPRQSGSVGFLSQSGGMAIRLPRRLMGWGISCSKVISFGNACDINEVDLLEYLAGDPETKIITAYLEGTRAGSRLLEAAREAARIKPLIVWKAGLTGGGARAARSHTASLAGNADIWQAFFKQTGAIQAGGLDDLIDITILLLHPANYGPRVVILAGGGAISVAAADSCERNGLSLASLSTGTLNRIAAFLPRAGAAAGNPVDLGGPFPTTELLHNTLDALQNDDNVDVIIMDEIEFAMAPPIETPVDIPLQVSNGKAAELVLKIGKQSKKPLIAVMPVEKMDLAGIEIEKARRKFCQQFFNSGIPVFLSLERAARAIGRVISYQQNFIQLIK